MKWYGCALVAILLALVAPSPASAEPPQLRLKVDRHALHSGQVLTVTATATGGCTWILTWSAERQVGRGRTATATFTAPVVTAARRIPVHARCFPDVPVAAKPSGPPRRPPAGGAAQTISVKVPVSLTATVVVTVLPPGSGVAPPGDTDPPTGLPGTGGPQVWLLVAGLGLVLGGGVLVRSARSRR